MPGDAERSLRSGELREVLEEWEVPGERVDGYERAGVRAARRTGKVGVRKHGRAERGELDHRGDVSRTQFGCYRYSVVSGRFYARDVFVR